MAAHLFKATIVTAKGELVRLGLVCPSLTAAAEFIDRAHPEARYVSLMVQRKGSTPC
jgi:hypothetical protein